MTEQNSAYDIIRTIARARVPEGEALTIEINGTEFLVSSHDIAAANLIVAAGETLGGLPAPDDLLSIFNAGIFWIELMVRISMAELLRDQQASAAKSARRRPRPKQGDDSQDGPGHRRGM